MCPSGQSRSLQGFLGVELGFGIEAKGRSGREVGKCGFVSVGGTDDLDAPIARGEETEGREYIMAGSWREGVRTDGGRESKKKLTARGRRDRRRRGGGELTLRDEDQLRAEYINYGQCGCPQRAPDRTDLLLGSRKTT